MHISTLLSGYPQTIYSENTSHLDTQLQKAERQSPHACEQEMTQGVPVGCEEKTAVSKRHLENLGSALTACGTGRRS